MRGVLSGSHLDGETGCCSLKWLCWHETPEKFPSLSSAAGETEDIRLRHLRNPASSVSSRWSAVMIKHERWMALIDLTGCLKTVFKQYRMETDLVNSWMLKNVPYNLMSFV